MADDLMSDGDPWSALRGVLQRGAHMPQGRMPGLQDLLQQLRKRRQQQLDRYDLGSVMQDLAKKLDQVLQTEREGIRRRMPEGAERQGREARLDQLPPDVPGRIRELQ